MGWEDRIETKPDVLVGKPVIKGTRLAVELILDELSWGWTYEDILDSYPGLTREDILACLAYAKDAVQSEHVYAAEVEA
ncbi:MAG: DUF433 domain-containing protein [Armatimonadetes bacterium]|nr:DUF433 domain-containing protein [Armatimonadota bacterium]